MKKTATWNRDRSFLPYSNLNQKASSDEADTQINRTRRVLSEAQNLSVGTIKMKSNHPAQQYFSGGSGFFIRTGGFSSQSKIKTARPEAMMYIITTNLANQNTNWRTYDQELEEPADALRIQAFLKKMVEAAYLVNSSKKGPVSMVPETHEDPTDP